MTRNNLLAALAASALMGAVPLAQAVPAVVAPSGPTVYSYPGQTVIVQPAPPAPLSEAVPAPREGYVWAPGHFEWRNGQYAWIGGEWITARPGFAWHAGHWEQRADGNWQFVAGHWIQTDDYASADREQRRGPFGDRDGDGVINRDDRFPRDSARF